MDFSEPEIVDHAVARCWVLTLMLPLFVQTCLSLTLLAVNSDVAATHPRSPTNEVAEYIPSKFWWQYGKRVWWLWSTVEEYGTVLWMTWVPSVPVLFKCYNNCQRNPPLRVSQWRPANFGGQSQVYELPWTSSRHIPPFRHLVFL